MKLHFEFGSKQINKSGEELCGDNIVFTVLPDSLTLVLSDGLGSGVKANILATLTSKIATRMIARGLPVHAVVETLSQTLPVCNVRKLAYSTFTIAQFFWNGSVSLTEFDSPHAFCLRRNASHRLHYDQREIESRVIHNAEFKLSPGDWLVMISDGVINAGIGGVLDLGWDWDSIAAYLERRIHPQLTAGELANILGEEVLKLYEGHCGDDVTIAVIKARHRRFTTVLTGAPVDPETDEAAVKKFMRAHGKRVCCGGTTANIVARVLQQEVEVDLDSAVEDVPPTGRIKGVDLVTEGVLTLSKTLENLRAGVTLKEIQFKIDGASALTRALLDADEIRFLVGRAINPAHQNPDLPEELGLKSHIANEMRLELEKLGKTIRLEQF